MLDQLWKRHRRRLWRHSLWTTVSLTLLLAARTQLPAEALRSANEVGGNFLQAFVGVYGLVLAFVLFVVWGQHNETQVSVEREAVLVGELYRQLNWFDVWPQRDQARALLRRYVHNVPVANTHPLPTELPPEAALLEEVAGLLLPYAPSSPREERLWPLAVDLMHELSQAREHRVTTASLRLPLGLRWFVMLGGAASVTIMFFLRVEVLWVQAIFTAMLTWCVVATLTIVLDLDDPYTGDFIVDWSRFLGAQKRMDGLACPRSTPPPK